MECLTPGTNLAACGTNWVRICLSLLLVFGVGPVASADELRVLGSQSNMPARASGSAGFTGKGMEGKAHLSLISNRIRADESRVLVVATVTVTGIPGGGAEGVYYVLDPSKGYTRFHGAAGTGYTGIDEKKGIHRTNRLNHFRFVFPSQPGKPIVAWVEVYKERGIFPTSHGAIEVKGTVPEAASGEAGP